MVCFNRQMVCWGSQYISQDFGFLGHSLPSSVAGSFLRFLPCFCISSVNCHKWAFKSADLGIHISCKFKTR